LLSHFAYSPLFLTAAFDKAFAEFSGLQRVSKTEVQSFGSFFGAVLRNSLLENTSETEFQKRFKQRVRE